MDHLDPFHPLVRNWFAQHFPGPTDIQARAWPAIARGEHVLITAPTGSGKTLTAFLWAINQWASGAWEAGATRVLYVSPLKALNSDIRRNLEIPLAQLAGHFEAAGESFPAIRAATRSGDTPQSQRRRMILHPPEILITTPESLNLMLSSQSGRSMLTQVSTVILDEIHSVLATKRGTHLITAVDRLVPLAGEFQRIALSATLSDMETVADFVGGYARSGPSQAPVYTPRRVHPIRSRQDKAYEIQVCFPEPPETDADAVEPPPSVWDTLAPIFRERVSANRSTLFFTNGRRLCEKLTFKINQGLEFPLAFSHHGSLAKSLRREVEAQLKQGKLKAIVATSSLEMGIDIGSLDEVVLVQAPPTVSAAVQRLGRAGHQVSAVSRGRIFPAHAADLIPSAVLARAVTSGVVEKMAPVRAPLDVLAQVLISCAGTEIWELDDLFALIRTSWPYHDLSREHFDLVVEMLAGKYSTTRVRELSPRLSLDRLDQTVTARKGALHALYMSGGTIPDRGYFKLRHQETGAIIGELDEEYVWEAKTGQIATLGSRNWRIQRITHNDVFVLPVGQRQMDTPFWLGEAMNRDFHFSRALGDFLEQADAWLAAGEHKSWMAGDAKPDPDNPMLTAWTGDHCLTRPAARALAEFLDRQRRQTQVALPHRRHLVLEYVNTGPGGVPGTMLVIHTLWGGRVNRPFALALERAWFLKFKEKLEVFPGNDAVVLQLPRKMDPEDFLALVPPGRVEELLRAQLEQSAFFAARFRECAGRALLVTRQRMNQRMPLWMTRLRSQKLMENVLAFPDFPILLESWRSCLQDEFDLPALDQVLGELESGAVTWSACRTGRPSPFAAAMAWDQVNQYMYQRDLPGSRVSSLGNDLIQQAVFSQSLRPLIPPAVVAEFETKRRRLAPGYAPDQARELVDWVKDRLAIPPAEWAALTAEIPDAVVAEAEVKLARLTPRPGHELVVALEQREELTSAWWGGGDRETGLAFLAQWLGFYGPRTRENILEDLALAPEILAAWLADLVEAGSLIQGTLVQDGPSDAHCDAANFETLIRMARARAIPEFEPLALTRLAPFLARIQGLGRPAGDEDPVQDIYDTLTQLACLPLGAGEWEAEILPARQGDYHPSFLDSLLQEGELSWMGCGRESLTFCAAPDRAFMDAPEGEALPDALESGAAYDAPALKRAVDLPSESFVPWIWEQVWAGQLSSEGFADLRRGLASGFKAVAPRRRMPARRSRRRRALPGPSAASLVNPLPFSGRFVVPEALPAETEDPVAALEGDKDRARLLLDRYGMVFRELLNRELPPFRWGRIFKALYLMELSGEILSGAFFKGITGPQFITHSAFRRLKSGNDTPGIFWMAARDPASPCGLGLKFPGPKLPPRARGNHLVFKNGELAVISRGNGTHLEIMAEPADPDLPALLAPLVHLLQRRSRPLTRINVETINGEPAARSVHVPVLESLFDVDRDHRKLVLFRKYGA